MEDHGEKNSKAIDMSRKLTKDDQVCQSSAQWQAQAPAVLLGNHTDSAIVGGNQPNQERDLAQRQESTVSLNTDYYNISPTLPTHGADFERQPGNVHAAETLSLATKRPDAAGI